MLRTVMTWLLEKGWSEWQLVGTFEEMLEYREDYRDIKCRAYIHCFESTWGSRRVQVIIARSNWFNGSLRKKVLLGKTYQTEVYPWLKGRQNTKIPGFVAVKSRRWDFTKALKGETPVVLNDDEKQ